MCHFIISVERDCSSVLLRKSMGVTKGEKKTDKLLLEYYHDPENPGHFGDIECFAKENGI